MFFFPKKDDNLGVLKSFGCICVCGRVSRCGGMWRWYPGGRPDPPDGRNSDRDSEKNSQKKSSKKYTPIPFTKIEHWSVLVKGMGLMGAK